MSKKATNILIMMVAMNLRLAVTAISPLFPLIQKTFHLNSSYTAWLVTIPLLCFAMGALITPKLLHRTGFYHLLQIVSLVLVAANIIRPFSAGTLIIGTIIVGLGIAILNVLVPTLIAHTQRITQLTSLYSAIMNAVAAFGTAIIIPLATLFGWQIALALLSVPAVLILVAARLSSTLTTASTPRRQQLHVEIHVAHIFWLTLFMGLQSLIFYSLTAWLPTILVSLGASEAEAGLLMAVFQLVGIPAAFFITWIAQRRLLITIIALGYLAGMTALLFGRVGWWLATLILGFTCSLIFTLALTLIGSSSSKPQIIAKNSAIAQAVGYLLAAIGPLLFGQLQVITNSWTLGLIIFGGLMFVTILVGLKTMSQQNQLK